MVASAIAAEASQLERAIRGMVADEWAFVAKQQRPYVKSVVLVGRRGGTWRPVIDVWYGDHQARAQRYAAQINAAALSAPQHVVAVEGNPRGNEVAVGR